MVKNIYQVVPALDGGWNVKKYGSLRASKHFPTKEAAEVWGRARSIRQRSDLVIHRRDGTVAYKSSYGRSDKK